MRRRLVLILALAAGVLAGSSTGRGQKRPPFTLAVVRADGVIIPFASFIDNEWKNLWPPPREKFDVPVALADVPKDWWPERRPQTEWTLWLRDGTSRPLKVLAPAWFRAQCLANVGLRTDYRSSDPLPPPDAAPFPKDGLATSVAPGSEPGVEPVTLLDESGQDWRWMQSGLAKPFQAAEDRAFREVRGRLPRAPDATTRMNTPIAIEALYRAPDAKAGDFVYYFEATRRYPNAAPTKKGEPPCDLLTYGWGWVRARSYVSDTTVFAKVTDCYRWNVTFVLPLGILRAQGGHPIWVMQSSSWQTEGYFIVELVEPAKPRTLLETPGGWCY